MNRSISLVVFIFLLCGFTKIVAQGAQDIVFVQNLGQFPQEVQYYATIPGGMLFVEDNSLSYTFSDPKQQRNHSSHFDQEKLPDSINYHAVKLNFLGANVKSAIMASEPVATRYSFFKGNDASQWIKGAKGYKTITIGDIYDQINLVLSATPGGIKYDIMVAPGIDPSCIQIQYSGAEKVDLKQDRLIVEIPYASLTEQIPASFAICDNQRREIKARYRLQGDIVSFDVDAIEPGEGLLIDPLLVFSTYSGSPSDNWGNTATFDEEGNAYAGGITTTIRGQTVLTPFPATPGAYQTVSGGGWDVALLKFDSLGQNLLYATYLGGSGTEVPQSLIVDANGNLLILGVTSSIDFPTTPGAFDQTYNGGSSTTLIPGIEMPGGSDLFVAKLSNDGSELLHSTFIGGTSNDGALESISNLVRNYGDESRGDINFDAQGNVLVASRTESNDFPVVNPVDDSYNGNTDAVIFSLKPDLSQLNFSTYLGGVNTDVALSIKLGNQDEIYVAGGTSSADFPVTGGAYKTDFGGDVDGWVAQIGVTGDALVASSYIGTPSYDQVFFMDLDANNEVYLAGQTQGDYPVTSGKFSTGIGGQFIQKLTKNLDNAVFSTVVNRPGINQPSISLTAFLVNECNNIYLSGWGSPILNVNPTAGYFTLNTQGLPVTGDAYQGTSDGSSFYLMVLLGDASELLYATHLGDASAIVHVDGGTSRFDKNGIVYHSVCASCNTSTSTFPTTTGAYAEVKGSSGCNNAIFKFDLASLRARIQTNNAELTNPGLSLGCEPLTVVFENLSTAGEIYEWDFGDGAKRSVTTKDTLHHTYLRAGTYAVELRAYDPNTCIAEDYTYTSVVVVNPNFSVSAGGDICGGASLPLIATGGDQYLWSPVDGLDDPSSATPLASPQDTTTYTVLIINNSGCEYTGTVTVNVIPEIKPNVYLEEINICEGSRIVRFVSESENTTGISWSLGDGTVRDVSEFEYQYQEDGNYEVNVALFNQQCSRTVPLSVNIAQVNIPNVLTRNNDNINDVLKVTSARPIGLSIYTRWGTEVFSAAEYNNDWNGQNLSSGIYYYEALIYNGEVCSGWIQLLND